MSAVHQRRWSLAAAIACVTVFGLSIGQGAPLLSLLLESRGTDTTLTGLSSGTAFVGVLIGPLLTPGLLRRFGMRPFLLACLAVEVIGTLALKLFETLPDWVALRIALAAAGSSIFTASEAWITALAGDAARGRILGLYGAMLSAGIGLGPLILWQTGIEGWTPFVVNAVITAVAALPLLGAAAGARGFGAQRSVSPLRMFARAPFLVVAVGAFGFYETALINLLPIWGVRLGFSRDFAAATLSAIFFGSILLQVPVGWLGDHVRRATVLRLCAAVGLLGALAVLAARPPPGPLLVLLMLWGGIAAGIYPIALAIAGARFTGGDQVAVNAAIIIAYGTGALTGPVLGGMAMDVWNPNGLFVLFAALFAALLAATFVIRRGGGTIVPGV